MYFSNFCLISLEYFQECHINEKLASLASKGKTWKCCRVKAKKPQLGKKRKFRGQKSIFFADFHEDAKILQDMKAEEFAATLRKLEDSVDDEFFRTFLSKNDGENAQNGAKIQNFGP